MQQIKEESQNFRRKQISHLFKEKHSPIKQNKRKTKEYQKVKISKQTPNFKYCKLNV